MSEHHERPISIRWPSYALKVKTRGVLSWGDFIAIMGAVWFGSLLADLTRVVGLGWLFTR